MRAWQDRGEVLDSDDDEDLTLETDSQSPRGGITTDQLISEYVTAGTKRRRLATGDGLEPVDNEQSKDPAAASSAETIRIIGNAKVLSHVQVSSPTSSLARYSVFAEPREPSPQLGENLEIPRSSPPLRSNASQTTAPASEGVADEPTGADFEPHGPSTPRNESTVAILEGSQISSALSSPLSEMLYSPSPPPGRFFLVGQAGDGSSRRSHLSGSTSPTIQTSYGTTIAPAHDKTLAFAPDSTAAAYAARRGLRTRNEKQLHPYMFDQAQYQRQCRERGMRPVRLQDTRASEPPNLSTSSEDEDAALELVSASERSPYRAPLEDLDRVRTEVQPPQNRRGPIFNFDISSSEDEPEALQNVMGRGTTSRLEHPKSLKFSSRTKSLPRPELLQHRVPTPPPTSSGSAEDGRQQKPARVFRMPLGMSITAPRTPQISSDATPGRAGQLDDSSDDEPHVVGSRRVAKIRQLISSDSSSEASSLEPAADQTAHDNRLQREQRRIRGVLPASWLRIDLRAQQLPTSRSPMKTSHPTHGGPVVASPQKGVARIVSARRSNPQPFPQSFDITDDDSDSEASQSTLTFSALRQARLNFSEKRRLDASTDLNDEDLMEVDFVDPMLAGASSTRPRLSNPKRKSRQPRQPRIDDALARVTNPKENFGEEQRALRLAKSNASRRARPRARPSQRPSKLSSLTPRLSILDAPIQYPHDDIGEPQFVRLAKRQARHRRNLARHSPHQKQIRLATMDETEDALSVLRDWRKGSIKPATLSTSASNALRSAPSNGAVSPSTSSQRAPLVDVTNTHQRRQSKSTKIRQSSKGGSARTPQQSRVQAHLQRGTREQSAIQQNSTSPEVGEVTEEKSRARKLKRVRKTTQLRHRAGQLETLENDFASEHRDAAFARRIHCLTEAIAPVTGSSMRHNLPLARYLDIEDAQAPLLSATNDKNTDVRAHAQRNPREAGRTLPHRNRKRLSCRIDADARNYRQPAELNLDLPATDERAIDVALSDTHGLLGLKPVGSRYEINFDISPLQLGTYFHHSSFVGSGDLAASLRLVHRDLTISSGRIRIHFDDEVHEWGPWTQEVSTGLARIPRAVREAISTLSGIIDPAQLEAQTSLVEANVDYLLRSTVRYFSNCISFIDSVDRRGCIEGICRLVEELLESVNEEHLQSTPSQKPRIRCIQYAAVLARQGHDLAKDMQITSALRQECRMLLLSSAKTLVARQPNILAELRTFFEHNRHASKRENGIQDHDVAVSTIVVLHHLLRDPDPYEDLFWTAMSGVLGTEGAGSRNVRVLDNIWYSLLTLLPLQEIDEQGVLRLGLRLQGGYEHCDLVKTILQTVFHSSRASSLTEGNTINEYIRATLTRSAQLVTIWGWWRCEAILSPIYDFFARRNLMPLQNEICHGSPTFLGYLEKQPSLEVQPEDRSFHIFLKMLASALSGMRKYSTYSDKKIGGIGWRFMPNHGRTYRRDAEVRQEDIEALRNHHDLLCTLYYAAPPDHRLRVGLLQELVNHSISHREACRLNVRAWSNLASFQASSGEPLDRLDPFCSWFTEILSTTLSQYRLVRAEVDQEIATARMQGAAAISSELIEATVVRNQRQIVATLTDALAACRRCLLSANGLDVALRILQGSQVWLALELYDPSLRRLNSMLEEGIDVVVAAIDVQARFQSSMESQQISEDSQEFGDNTALLEFADTQMPLRQLPNVVDVLQEPFGQLLSNVFGADSSADDMLLSKIIDAWVRLAGESVERRQQTWMNFVDAYSACAWTQLRDTEHKRRFTPYFLSRVLDCCNGSLVGPEMLSMWLASLAEREASLKYQHLLTAALLQHGGDEVLLHNLPFSVSSKSGKYEVTLAELRQRRLPLISSILSNMRQSSDDTARYRPRETKDVRRAYGAMLQQLMRTMKANYLEVEASSTVAATNPHTQGGYVDFVQQVVYFMQQYTTSIQAIDDFFTDSAAFPLPATDPTYVVGKLRSYVPRLSESGTKKQLLSFLQSLCERAAVDRQQECLVEQLTDSMTGVAERGNAQAPSLRQLVCTTLFSAYVESSLETGASWILALPVLQAWAQIIKRLLYDALLDDVASAEAAVSIVETFLASVLSPMRTILCHPGLLSLLHVQRWLSTAFDALRASLTTAQHLGQILPASRHLAAGMERAVVFAARTETALLDSATYDALDTELEGELDEPLSPWPDVRAYARDEVARTNRGALCAQDGRYFLRKNGVGREIVVDLDESGGERIGLLTALNRFCSGYAVVFGRRATGLATGRSIDDGTREAFGEVFV